MAKGKTTTAFGLHLRDEELRIIDRRAKGKGLTRSECLRRLIRRGLGLPGK